MLPAPPTGRALLLTRRLQDLWGEAASEMLTVQYRMNSAIMDWSSQARLGALSASRAAYVLPSVAGVVCSAVVGCPMREYLSCGRCWCSVQCCRGLPPSVRTSVWRCLLPSV